MVEYREHLTESLLWEQEVTVTTWLPSAGDFVHLDLSPKDGYMDHKRVQRFGKLAFRVLQRSFFPDKGKVIIYLGGPV